MKWTDNLLLEGDGPEIKERGQWQLAMYALHLSTGQSIYCKRIRASTIEQYVYAAATFLLTHTGVDFRKDNPTDTNMGHILAPVYRDLKSYEAVPNRREPYDLQMHKLARDLAREGHRDSLVAALVDGFEQGICAGYRLTEWAQPAGRSSVDAPQLNHLVSATIRTRAIVPDDIRCQTDGHSRATGVRMLLFPYTTIVKIWVTWRTQKNGMHGEEKLFTRNPNPDGICMVRSTYSALQRFQRLQGVDGRLRGDRTPLSDYLEPLSGTVKLVTATDIETFMRRLAVQVYHLHPVKDAIDIRRWSAHSLRVGACVVLHAMGFSGIDIQWILRWRSMTFMTYLRNVAILATKQYRALDKAAALPHLV